MISKRMIVGVFMLTVCLVSWDVSHGTPRNEEDRTLSPYFFVQSEDPETDRLPLQSTRAQVNISGVMADVRVTQVYKNEGSRPLEGIYVFPASTRAAVYGMEMTIGERTIRAKIRKREEARQDYERAKQEGKSASLLEQHRPNVFQMNVANILPGDVIKVELRYTELLVPTDAVYEFVYPTVVGPRYVDGPDEKGSPSEGWTSNPYLHEGESPPYAFEIVVNLSAGLPIQDIACGSHKTTTIYRGPDFASVSLDPLEKNGGNRDFILKYRLAGGGIQTGLLLFEGEEENFFLLMVQPPSRVVKDQIPPREYVFIVDVSGSMHGFPLNISKRLLKDLMGNLRPVDTFNVLLFAGGSHLLSERSLPATPENLQQAIALIEKQRGGGGTRLVPALKSALSLPKSEGHSRIVVIATDGYVSVEEEAFELIRNHLDQASVFAFGIGSSVNRHLIEGMSRAGMGEPFVITKPEQAAGQADRFRKLIECPVLTGIRVHFDQFDAYAVEPPAIPDVMGERPVIVFGKYRGNPQGRMTLTGSGGDGPFVKDLEISQVRPVSENAALPYLWARHRIALLSDLNRLHPQADRVREVTNLGLSYSLLTAYTSFVAVDTQVRLKNGQPVTVKQPLPLPQGVSDYAVGEQSLRKRSTSALSLALPASGLKDKVMDERLLSQKESRPALEREKAGSCNEKRVLELGEVIIEGNLPRESIERALQAHVPSFELCYTRATAKQPMVKGKVIVKMVIDPAGRVMKVEMEERLRGSEFGRCLILELEKLIFPAPKGGEKAMVTFTLLLK